MPEEPVKIEVQRRLFCTFVISTPGYDVYWGGEEGERGVYKGKTPVGFDIATEVDPNSVEHFGGFITLVKDGEIIGGIEGAYFDAHKIPQGAPIWWITERDKWLVHDTDLDVIKSEAGTATKLTIELKEMCFVKIPTRDYVVYFDGEGEGTPAIFNIDAKTTDTSGDLHIYKHVTVKKWTPTIPPIPGEPAGKEGGVVGGCSDSGFKLHKRKGGVWAVDEIEHPCRDIFSPRKGNSAGIIFDIILRAGIVDFPQSIIPKEIYSGVLGSFLMHIKNTEGEESAYKITLIFTGIDVAKEYAFASEWSDMINPEQSTKLNVEVVLPKDAVPPEKGEAIYEISTILEAK